MSQHRVRIRLRGSGELLADGPLGWGITRFEGNYYVAARHLRSRGFQANFIPGICIYKFLYVWLDHVSDNGARVRSLAWKYWLPNPLLPFIWFRVALPGSHPALDVEEYREERR